MSVLLPNVTVALMVAGGFAEIEFTELQRALNKAGATMKTISTDNGLVNGWQGTVQAGAWGHYFPVDAQLGDVLAADLDALIIVGGDRSINKLKANMNSARILRHMLAAEKPVILFGAAVSLLEQIDVASSSSSLLTYAERETLAAEEWVQGTLQHIAKLVDTEALAAAA